MSTGTEILRPIAYTTAAGSKWSPWVFSGVTESKLEKSLSLPKRKGKCVNFNLGGDRFKLYSIKLSDGKVWDCIHGWN